MHFSARKEHFSAKKNVSGRKVHFSVGKCIFLQEMLLSAVYSGGLRVVSGSLFLDEVARWR